MKITELTLSDKVYKIVYERIRFDGLMSTEQYPTIVSCPITGIRLTESGKSYIVNYNEKYDSETTSKYGKKCWIEHDGKNVTRQLYNSLYNSSPGEDTKNIDKYSIDQVDAFKIFERLCDENINKLLAEAETIRVKIEKFKVLKKMDNKLPFPDGFEYTKKEKK